PTEEGRQLCASTEGGDLSPAGDDLGQVLTGVVEQATELGAGIGMPVRQTRGGTADKDAGLTGVGGDQPGVDARSELEPEPVQVDAIEIGVVDDVGGDAIYRLAGTDQGGDPRSKSVGADHDAGGDVGAFSASFDGDARYTVVGVTPGIHHAGSVGELDPGYDGFVRQDGVEDVPAGGVQRLDTEVAFHGKRDPFFTEAERHVTNCRRAGRCHPVQDPPARELQHARAQDGVGRDRVGRHARPVDQENVV